MSKCILCKDKEATHPDRNRRSRAKKLCSDCYSNRLRSDMLDIYLNKIKENSNEEHTE